MQHDQPSLFARDDTFFGVCQGLGEDFGFNPVYLRLALPVLLFFYPIATLAGYGVAAVAVLLARLVVPEPRIVADAQPMEAGVEAEEEAMPLAA